MKIFKIAMLLGTVLTMVQCQNEELNTIGESSVNDKEVSKEVIDKLNFLGFDTENYPVRLHGDDYIVEGDMVFSSKELATISTDEKQRRSANLISCANARNIRVRNFILNRIPNAEREFSAALREWNRVRGHIVRLVEVDSDHDILVSAVSNISGNAIGQGALPSNGEPGSSILLNDDFRNESRSFWKHVIIHELGHTLGFEHTDSNEGTQIDGTPNTDARSVMNTAVSPANTRLSRNDITALQALYGTNSRTRLCE